MVHIWYIFGTRNGTYLVQILCIYVTYLYLEMVHICYIFITRNDIKWELTDITAQTLVHIWIPLRRSAIQKYLIQVKKDIDRTKNIHHPDIIQVNKMPLCHSFRLLSKKLSQTKCFVGNEIRQFFELVAQKLALATTNVKKQHNRWLDILLLTSGWALVWNNLREQNVS